MARRLKIPAQVLEHSVTQTVQDLAFAFLQHSSMGSVEDA